MGLKIGLEVERSGQWVRAKRGWTGSTMRQQTCRQGVDCVCWLFAFSAIVGLGNHPLPD